MLFTINETPKIEALIEKEDNKKRRLKTIIEIFVHFCYIINFFILFRIDLPVRANLRKCELRGIFPGAKVVRGFNWEWGNQDGGEGIVKHNTCHILLSFYF